MPVDIETQLRHLGNHFRAEITHIHPDEILDETHTIAPESDTHRLVESVERRAGPSRTRLLTAAAAALVLLLIGGLMVTSRRDDGGAAMNDQRAACDGLDYLVSFDAQLLPAFDSEPADTGYPSAKAAAEAYLADRTNSIGATLSGPNVSYEILDTTTVIASNTILRANLRVGTATGTVDIAARAVQTTKSGTRWIIEAAASDVTAVVIRDFDDGRVTLDIDPFTTGTNYATTYDPSSGETLDAAGTQTASGSTEGSTPPLLLNLETGGISNPLLRYWFVNADKFEFAEVQLNEGYPDHGEGWQSLEKRQLC